MIRLSNGIIVDNVVASGALAFNPTKGWLWDWPLIWLGLIRPELFTLVIKTVTRHPRKGNLRWWNPLTWLPFSPWSCVRFLPRGGVVNKVGLTNPGIEWWCREVAPTIDFSKYNIVASIQGTEEELVEMALMLNPFNLAAVKVNISCPNTGHDLETEESAIKSGKAVRKVSRHPLIIKVSVDQPYLRIADGLRGVAEAIAINSVPWKTAFPNGEVTPLRLLENKVGGGGGGVSGRPAQELNWKAVAELAQQGALPVIAPSIMRFEDVEHVKLLGADAVSFGAIHLRTPWKPTSIVKRMRKQPVQEIS